MNKLELIMSSNEFKLSCPIPIQNYPQVLLAHGGGGKLMHDLIAKMFMTAFDNDILRQKHDAALLNNPSCPIAYTTDSYVVQPLFFPGGNIVDLDISGNLATEDDVVCDNITGTVTCGDVVNDIILDQSLTGSMTVGDVTGNISIGGDVGALPSPYTVFSADDVTGSFTISGDLWDHVSVNTLADFTPAIRLAGPPRAMSTFAGTRCAPVGRAGWH